MVRVWAPTARERGRENVVEPRARRCTSVGPAPERLTEPALWATVTWTFTREPDGVRSGESTDIAGTGRGEGGQLATLWAQTPETVVNWPPTTRPHGPAEMVRTPKNWLKVGRKLPEIAPDEALTPS